MNRERACTLLDIKKGDINEKTLKKQYHLKALEYHPDKCNDEDASDKFKEIKEAYEYLKEYHELVTEDDIDVGDNMDEDSTNESSTRLTSYESLVRYFTGSLDEYLQEEYTHILLEKLLTICEKQAIDIINKTDDRKFGTIYKILTKYKNVFHLSAHFYEEMEKTKLYRFIQGDMKKKRMYDMVNNPDVKIHKTFTDPYIHIPDDPVIPVQPPPRPKKRENGKEEEEEEEEEIGHKIIDSEWDLEIEMKVPYKISKESSRMTETMILKPSLDDLWENNLYKYTDMGLTNKTFLIPLWHHEIVYELNEETDFTVKLQPKMPSNNIWIDADNHLQQTQEYSMYEIWGFASKEKCMFVFFGSRKFMFYPHELLITKYQTFTWYNQGLSKINEDNTYDVSQKGDVTLHIYIN